MEKLKAYDWPGNVRELENVMERAVILSKGTVLKIPELGRNPHFTHTDESVSSLKENERSHIVRMLKLTGGKITGPGGAAERLDIHPNTLYSRMKKLGIKRLSQFSSQGEKDL